MPGQDHYWSKAAEVYEHEFIDPWRKDVRNPLTAAIQKIPKRLRGRVADLGCGIGPLLPTLGELFHEVWAVDFAEGMLARAREKCKKLKNIQYLRAPFSDLSGLPEEGVHVAVAVNSLVLPNTRDLDLALLEIFKRIKPGGLFLGIIPAMDAVHYLNMLLLDRALAMGKPMADARKNVAHLAEHGLYDFGFGQFRYQGLEQHFWHPFEIRHRFRQAGFEVKALKKVHLSWKQFPAADALNLFPPPWDWFFHATRR